jgi:tetratricopeptide (TPR) repeat protein
LIRKQQTLRNDVIQEYLDQLKEEPDNLRIREVLVQTYFWNGLKDQAVREYGSILANNYYRDQIALAGDNQELNSLLDRLFILYHNVENQVQTAQALVRENFHIQSEYRTALSFAQKQPEVETAQTRYETAKESMLLHLEAVKNLLEQRDLILLYREEMETDIKRFKSGEEQADAAFQELVKHLNWRWDWDFTRQELESIIPQEPVLTSTVLGGYLLSRGEVAEAEQQFQTALDAGGSSFLTEYGKYQTLVWQNKKEEKSQFLQEAKSLSASQAALVNLTEELELMLEIFPVDILPEFTEDTQSLVQEAGLELKGFGSRSLEILASLEKDRQILLGILSARTNRHHFFLSQQMAPLRFTLGDYLLDLGRNREAADQFKQILAVDPWNISAKYKLGVVSQLYGHWSQAMESYRSVYYQDPDYQNVVTYYNQLARANADTFLLEASTLWDNRAISYHTRGELINPVSTFWGLNLMYRGTVEKIYNNSPSDSTIPSTVFLQDLEAALPFRLKGINLEVVPRGGALFWQPIFNTYANIPGLDMENLIEGFSLHPVYGLDLSWEAGPYGASLAFAHHLMEDSTHRGRIEVPYEELSGAFTTYFLFPRRPLLQLLATRTSGHVRFLEDGNLLSQAVQTAVLGMVPYDDFPWQVQLDGTFSWENSKQSSYGNYYAPDGVLEAKIGLKNAVTLHNDDWSRILEISLWGAGGGYWTGAPEALVKGEGLFSLVYSRWGGNLLLQGSLYLAGSFDPGNGWENRYWQGAVKLGGTIKVPGLLAD